MAGSFAHLRCNLLPEQFHGAKFRKCSGSILWDRLDNCPMNNMTPRQGYESYALDPPSRGGIQIFVRLFCFLFSVLCAAVLGGTLF